MDKTHATRCCNGNLSLSPVRRGKVRMGVVLRLGEIKFVWSIEPPSS